MHVGQFNSFFYFYKMKPPIYVLLLMGYTVSREVDYCFVNETAPYLNFGAKTPYRYASSGKFQRVVVPNCEPVQIWMLARHGTRYPQSGAIDRLQEVLTLRWKIIHSHEDGKGHLCDDDVEKIKRWSPNPRLTTTNAGKLTGEGMREGLELGRRLKGAYPEIFQSSIKDANSQDYVFRSLKASRTIMSLKAMIKGIFGDESAVELAPNVNQDTLLRPDRNCPRWSHADRNPQVQRDEFIGGPEYTELLQNVGRRVGFDVLPATIHNMQDMCRFETAWSRDGLSPWCAVFSTEEWEIIEYIDDIQYYYYSGYGVPLNTIIGCFPAEDLINHFREAEHSETQKNPKGVFYMSTSRVLMDFLHVLGIAKDSQHLLSSNYELMKNRKWRTSLIAPFFANFIATFYRCNEASTSNKITFHLNEKLIMYDGCDEGICDWNYMEEKLEKKAYKCAENCSGRKPAPAPEASENYHSIFLIIIAFCIFTIIFHRGIARTLIRCR